MSPVVSSAAVAPRAPVPVSAPAPTHLGSIATFAAVGHAAQVGPTREIVADGPARSLRSSTLDAALHEAATIQTSGVGALVQADSGFQLINAALTSAPDPIASFSLVPPTPGVNLYVTESVPEVQAFVSKDRVALTSGDNPGAIHELQ
jgi:hypothetical protein